MGVANVVMEDTMVIRTGTGTCVRNVNEQVWQECKPSATCRASSGCIGRHDVVGCETARLPVLEGRRPAELFHDQPSTAMPSTIRIWDASRRHIRDLLFLLVLRCAEVATERTDIRRIYLRAY